MHELALKVSKKETNEFGVSYRLEDQLTVIRRKHNYEPAGSVVSAVSDDRRIYTWVQIVCDLASPEKRDKRADTIVEKTGWTLAQWDTVVGMWSTYYADCWAAISRTKMPEALTLAKDLWAKEIENTSGWKDSLGLDPGGTACLCDVFTWSIADKKENFVIALSDGDWLEIENYNGRNEAMIGDLPVHTRKKYVDFTTDMGLSAGTLTAIADKDVIVQPRYDLPIAKAIVRDVLPAAATITTNAECLALIKDKW